MRKTTMKKPAKRICKAKPEYYMQVTFPMVELNASETLSRRLEIATKRYEDAINNLIAKL